MFFSCKYEIVYLVDKVPAYFYIKLAEKLFKENFFEYRYPYFEVFTKPKSLLWEALNMHSFILIILDVFIKRTISTSIA